MTCPELDRLDNMEINHETEYTEAFYDLSDEEKDSLTYEQEQAYIQDKDAEDRHTDKIRTLKGQHFLTCSDENCQRIKGVWANHPELADYVKESKN